MAIWISCIIPAGDEAAGGIARVGGPFGWSEPEETVIGEIEAGAVYCVEVDQERVEVIVAERDGRKCLCTDPDVSAENDPLFLPRCP